MGSLRVTADASQIFAAQAPTQIASNFAFGLHTASRPVATNVMINEVDADTPGDDRAEFIELYGPPNTPLDGLAVVLYNGVSTFSPNPFEHQSYAAFDLDGKSTDANGYFVLGNPDVPGVGLTFDPGQFGLLQNGAVNHGDGDHPTREGPELERPYAATASFGSTPNDAVCWLRYADSPTGESVTAGPPWRAGNTRQKRSPPTPESSGSTPTRSVPQSPTEWLTAGAWNQRQ